MFGKCVVVLAAILCTASLGADAGATTTVKIGTLVPGNSPWAKAFKQWAADVSTDTNGELQIDLMWNGQAGDETLMVQKIRSGQLDGAAVSATGLAQTGVTDVLLFQLPGLFQTWPMLDAARDATRDEFATKFANKGFTILGWGDIGAAKTMTVRTQVHRPIEMAGKGLFFIPGDPIQPKVYAAIPGITPKQLQITEILPALSSGAVNVLVAPPLVAQQLQWASKITDIQTDTIAFSIGAVIFSSARLQSMPPGLRESILARSKETTARLNGIVRNMDAQAFAEMKRTKTTYSATDAERAEWRSVFGKVARELRGSVFSGEMFDKIVKLAGSPFGD